jgi:hypothetical protein
LLANAMKGSGEKENAAVMMRYSPLVGSEAVLGHTLVKTSPTIDAICRTNGTLANG